MYDEKLNFRQLFSFLFSEEINLESLRIFNGRDLDISDKIKKKHHKSRNISTISFKNGKNSLLFHSLNGKTGLLLLINSLKKGISVKKLLNTYPTIRKDLMDIVTYNGKKRVILLLKGKNIKNLRIYPFIAKFWVQNSVKLISTWHKIH